ncbi:MAG: hypothetical protein U0636_05965 [Phycisphaerales bacterium]
MAIETSLQPRQKWMNLFYALLCLVLALWGAYDYYVSIPQREDAVKRFDEAMAVTTKLQEKAEAYQRAPSVAPPLSREEEVAYEAAQKELASFKNEKPEPPHTWDRAVQLWAYMVGCGVLGTPWFLWALVSAGRTHYRLDDDGTLHAPEGEVKPEDMKDIDMSRWMSKSIATVQTTDGKTIKLDDYKFKNMHLIVGALASKFYPEDWTEDGRDRRKMEAEQAAEQNDTTQPS